MTMANARARVRTSASSKVMVPVNILWDTLVWPHYGLPDNSNKQLKYLAQKAAIF